MTLQNLGKGLDSLSVPPLAEFIRIEKGRTGVSYRELEARSDSIISAQRWQQLGTGVRMKEFPEPATLKAMAAALRVDVTQVVLASARSLGLAVREGVTFYSHPSDDQSPAERVDEPSSNQPRFSLKDLKEGVTLAMVVESLSEVLDHVDAVDTANRLLARQAAYTSGLNENLPSAQEVWDNAENALSEIAQVRSVFADMLMGFMAESEPSVANEVMALVRPLLVRVLKDASQPATITPLVTKSDNAEVSDTDARVALEGFSAERMGVNRGDHGRQEHG
ncbi:hypothetical protein [Mycobacteroides abscessus]|uniref:hypothetical protein n=1 Tax=Mycobacteroides abscessus TaxID=36809 RepID=UPI0012FFF92A|nr:hypothetical protein [Mycobacteroides abscessus]